MKKNTFTVVAPFSLDLIDELQRRGRAWVKEIVDCQVTITPYDWQYIDSNLDDEELMFVLQDFGRDPQSPAHLRLAMIFAKGAAKDSLIEAGLLAA